MMQRILVWDLPTRVFHWLLALSFLGAFVTAESERYRDIHVALGYTLLGLLAFRLLWGFIGTRYARFRSFLFSPAAVLGYARSLLKGQPAHYLGHNPLGSIAIWLLLALGISTGISGIVLYQDIGGDALEELHEVLANGMLAVVVIHIAGVLLSSVLHRENLVRAMITGFKSGKPDEGIRRSYRWLGVIMLAAVVAFWFGYPANDAATHGAATKHGHHHHDD